MKKRNKNEKVAENIWETEIPGLLIIERPTYSDERGWFREPLRINELEKVTGIKFNFKQWSHSWSKPRVIRALHSEEQNKIVYPITGSAFSAYVDVRPESKTFAKVLTMTFSQPNRKVIYIPKGVANSMCILGVTNVHYLYLIDAYFDPKKIKGIAWDDPDLNIPWPIKNPIISQRDKENPTMREVFPDKFK